MGDSNETKGESRDRAPGRYRRLVETSDDIVTVVDSDGTITYANTAVERVLGYDPQAVVGDTGHEYVHPEDREQITETFETVRSDPDESRTVEFRLRRSDGSWCPVEVTMRNLLDDDQVGGVVVRNREITGRTERARNLAATNERMELALEGANLGVWDWNMQTDEVSRDELLTDMLGYTQSEMGDRMRGWVEVVHPDDRKRHDEALAEHVSDRTPYYQCDHRLRTKSGEWKWVRTTGKVVERDENGGPLRAVGIHQDIDDRKRTKLALEEERDLFVKGPAVVFRWANADGWPVEYVSENVADVFGYTPSELQSGDLLFADLVHDDDIDRVVSEVTEHDESAADYMNPDPYRILTPDGDVRWVMEYTRYVDDEGKGSSLLGYLVDITERKEREQELQAREQKYRNLFEDTRDALMVLDRNGYLDCNERTLELFGIDSVDAFLDYSPWDLSPTQQPDGSDSKAGALDHIETAFEEGEAFFEWTHQRVDGTEFISEVKLSRFEYEGESALYALTRDITDRKAQQRRLEEQRDNLDVLNQVLRHDIRNDIQLITAHAELVADESDHSDVQEYIETVLENANHAVELTSTAREIADVMLSTDEDLQRVRLEPVVEDELEEVQSAYSNAVVRLESVIPSCTVMANDMIGSVFRNLLKNAIQHNDKDIPEVTVSASVREGRVLVRVADNGPGVPDDQKDVIFGKGEKGLDSRGTGIGLYLVDSLVDGYGGDVWVEDNDPTGASFVVALPTVGS